MERATSAETGHLRSHNVGGEARFYQVTLSDGGVRSLGAFTGNDVYDIAVPPGQS